MVNLREMELWDGSWEDSILLKLASTRMKAFDIPKAIYFSTPTISGGNPWFEPKAALPLKWLKGA